MIDYSKAELEKIKTYHLKVKPVLQLKDIRH